MDAVVELLPLMLLILREVGFMITSAPCSSAGGSARLRS
jgi:hypothetical protein